VADEPVLPDELAATVMRVDELVQHFEEYPDPLVRGPAMELLQLVDGLHRGGLRRLADLLRAAGLQRRALDEAEVRLLYDLYDLDQPDADALGGPAAPLPAASASPVPTSASQGPTSVSPVSTAAPHAPAGSFVPLARLLSKEQPRG
jgi:hypothetical protein